ncbi:MAG: hypothetical protein P8Y63_08335 [Deltaproteobacteria bacterium]
MIETHNLLKSIHRAFREQGITIPFPQRDLYVKGMPTGDTREILLNSSTDDN